MYMNESGRQKSGWRVAQNTGESNYSDYKLFCDNVPGQQTGTTFFRAMLKHILSASIKVPSLTVSLVETTQYSASMNWESSHSRWEEGGDGRKNRRWETYLIHQNRSIHASLFIQEALLRKMNRIGRDLRNHLTQPLCNAWVPFKISLPNMTEAPKGDIKKFMRENWIYIWPSEHWILMLENKK